MIDLPTRDALDPRSCHAVGPDVRFRGSLTAPAGGRARIEVTLQDSRTGRIVAGPATCDGLDFTKLSITRACGPAGASPRPRWRPFSTRRFTPAAGLSLTDVASGTAAVFSSGNVLVHSVTVETAAGVRPQLSRQEYAQLSFTRGGVAYVTDGYVQFDFDNQGRLSSGSGTVAISANGQPMARISATSGGFAIDILSAPPGFTAASPSIQRTRIGAAKAPAQGARNKRF
jgi:hypothetical protein